VWLPSLCVPYATQLHLISAQNCGCARMNWQLHPGNASLMVSDHSMVPLQPVADNQACQFRTCWSTRCQLGKVPYWTSRRTNLKHSDWIMQAMLTRAHEGHLRMGSLWIRREDFSQSEKYNGYRDYFCLWTCWVNHLYNSSWESSIKPCLCAPSLIWFNNVL